MLVTTAVTSWQNFVSKMGYIQRNKTTADLITHKSLFIHRCLSHTLTKDFSTVFDFFQVGWRTFLTSPFKNMTPESPYRSELDKAVILKSVVNHHNSNQREAINWLISNRFHLFLFRPPFAGHHLRTGVSHYCCRAYAFQYRPLEAYLKSVVLTDTKRHASERGAWRKLFI